MQKKLHIKVGDSVIVVAGTDKNKEGKILSIDRKKDRAIVEGANMITKHVKPNASNPQGGIEKREAGLHISNLMVKDPKDGKPTRVGRKLDENGKLVRYAKKSGEVL